MNRIRFFNLEPWQRTLYVTFLVQMITAMGFSSIFPFLPNYVEALGSASGLSIELLSGLVFSSQAIAMMITAPVWGAIADRYGRKLMVLRATFGGTVLLLLMAWVQNAEQLVLLRTIQGAVTGVLAANNALVASVVPRERSGYAMGLLEVGLGAGLALGPVVGGITADLFGYAESFYITSGALLLSGLLALFFVHEPPLPTVPAHHTRQPMLQAMVAEWRHLLSNGGVAATLFMRFMSQAGRLMIIPILPFIVSTLMRGEGAINTMTGIISGVAYAATTLSAVYLGKLGDRIGHRSVLLASLAASALIFIPQTFVTALWQFFALQIASGVAMGGMIPSISALLATFVDHGEEGAVYGLDASVNSAGRAIAPLLGAAVAFYFGQFANFAAVGVLFAIATLLGAYLLPIARPAPEPTPSSD